MRKKIFAVTAMALALSCAMAGCGNSMTEEEKAALAESQALAAAASEERETGLKRLTSVNLMDAEVSLYNFVSGIQNEDAQLIADAVGSPNIFPEGYLYTWILANEYDTLKDTALNDIRVSMSKSGSNATLDVYINSDEVTDTYAAVYENGAWILVPNNGVEKDFEFTAATKRVSYGDIDFSDYAISYDDSIYTWTFSMPHMLVLEDSPEYTIQSNLGTFTGKMYSTKSGNVILASMTDAQKDEFEGYAESAFTTVFENLKNGASKDDMTRILLSEKIISECYKNRSDEEAASYAEKLTTVNSVTMSEDDIQTGQPAAYTYRLAGEDAVILNVKLCINTSLGDSRKKATVTMQNFDGVWKIVNVTTKSGENPFVDFSTYNPAW